MNVYRRRNASPRRRLRPSDIIVPLVALLLAAALAFSLYQFFTDYNGRARRTSLALARIVDTQPSANPFAPLELTVEYTAADGSPATARCPVPERLRAGVYLADARLPVYYEAANPANVAVAEDVPAEDWNRLYLGG